MSQQQQQQQEQQQQRQQQEQQEPQNQQQHRQPIMATRKCCAFCAKRGERCDGLRPRCSLCIARNNMECRYLRTHPTKAKSKATPAAQLRVSRGGKGLVGQANLTSTADIVSPSSGRNTSDGFAVTSLKRYRLSPSPATGLMGMKENVFLNDYFECLGFLPLASASVVRQAIVELMLGSMPQKRQERCCVDAGRLTGGQEGKVRGESDEGDCVQLMAYDNTADDSSKCILWCAIALGALVQGCSLEFVGGYLQLAQDSLAECFDSTTVRTARAYLIMSVFQLFLGDQENSQRYIAFAKSIVGQLPPGVVPSDMKNMLLAEEDSMRLFYSCRSSGIGTKLNGESEGNVQIPVAKAVVHEMDLCNFYFIADRRMRKAFYQDIQREGDLTNLDGQGKRPHNPDMEGQPGQFQAPGELERMKGIGNSQEAGLRVRPRSGDSFTEGICPRSPCNIHQPGAAIKMCIEDAFSDLTRLLSVVDRCSKTWPLGVLDESPAGSDKCSGVAGLLFHGHMAYMAKVKGEKSACLRSIEACARVLTRFPGICRYRPHTAHCVLAAAASRIWRSVYDPVRDAYNSILPLNGTPAPPLEEWAGVAGICNNIFCRSMHVAPNNVDTASFSNVRFARTRTAASPKPLGASFSLHTSTVTSTSRGLLGYPACEEQTAGASAGEGWTAAAPLPFVNGVLLPPSDLSQTPPNHKDDITAAGEVQPEAEAEGSPPAFSETNWYYCDGIRRDCDVSDLRAGNRISALEPSSEGVDVNAQRSVISEETEGYSDSSRNVNETGVDRHVSPAMFVGDSLGNSRVEGFEVQDPEDDVAVVNCNTWRDAGFMGTGRERADICLTEQDFMDAAEVLISSDCPNEKMGGDMGVVL